MLHAGLDLSRRRLDVCLLDDAGELVARIAAPPDVDGLARLAARLSGVRVWAVIESMTGARFIHDTLEEHGWEVLVADAQKVKGLAPLACKTDKIDARVLAELSWRDLVPAIWLPDPSIRRERELARYGRCVMDGFAGARTDLSSAPSVDIANGAPSGADATDEIVMTTIDSVTLNDARVRFLYSTDGGATWNGPQDVNLPGDRGMYAAPAIAPDGGAAYVVYNADESPWRGADMSSPRAYRGVFRTSAIGANGAPTGWSTYYEGPLGDLRASYPGHDIYQERIGDYVYAAATRTYGAGVENDLRDAAVCGPVQEYRARSLAAGTRALPAPWPPAACPPTWGNLDIWAVTTG